jgi:carbohydrate-selective porin OprB
LDKSAPDPFSFARAFTYIPSITSKPQRLVENAEGPRFPPPGIRNGTGVELFCNFHVTHWLNITPDIQYIKQGLCAIADEAFVFGWRAHMNL